MPKSADRRYRKEERLRLNSDFQRIYAARKSASDSRMTVYVLPNGRVRSRLGLSVGRRAGSAVIRNRIRRRIKEAYRKNKGAIPAGLDIVCVVKPGAYLDEQEYADLLVRLIAKAAARP